MSPLERYERDLRDPQFFSDAVQVQAVEALQLVYEALLRPEPVPETGWLSRLRTQLSEPPVKAPVKGLYLWGGVGRGKTHLVDSFHEALPVERKMRIHFHRFMQRIHHELRSLGGKSDPLLTVADRIAAEARVLTFDEFHVSDITDAMLLGRLLDAMFARGVTLVTTSNIAPDGLYAGGLQRARFLPAIELLKRHTTVMNLGGDTDYRLRALEQAEIYHQPLDAAALGSLSASFDVLTGKNDVTEGQPLEVLGRSIDTVKVSSGTAWFDFSALCDGPRGAADYIEIAKLFHTVFVSNVPQFGAADNDRAIRFIMMVDEFYDHSVNLVLSAAALPAELYVGSRHELAFQRTTSRLIEMGSREYLHRPHLP
ncbi:MAG: cell division protein ZapE [Chromatiales bacterium]|nr:cell division protein ZapE [Chromatiales bacterium]